MILLIVVAFLLAVLFCGMLIVAKAIDQPETQRAARPGWGGLLAPPVAEPASVAVHDADMAARPQVTALTEDVPRPGHGALRWPASEARMEVSPQGGQGAGRPSTGNDRDGSRTGPGHLLIKAVPVQGHWLPLTPGEPKRFTANWQPVTDAVIPVRDRPALLRPWIAEALGAPSVDAAMAQIFGPRALALAGTP